MREKIRRPRGLADARDHELVGGRVEPLAVELRSALARAEEAAIVGRVVVLPAPLEPMSVTISPSST